MNNDLPPSCKFQNIMVTINSEFRPIASHQLSARIEQAALCLLQHCSYSFKTFLQLMQYTSRHLLPFKLTQFLNA